MIKRILQSVVFVLLACALFTGTAQGWNNEIIIQPNPIGGGGGEETPPAPIVASITVNPETLNLSSNIKSITVYITLPEGNVADILHQTIRITQTAGKFIEPIYALERPTGIEDDELMVKFDADEVKAVLTASAELNLVVAGELIDGSEFEGNDTFRTIGNYIPASERKNFKYILKGNITDGASIVRARVVMNYASKDRAHLLNAQDNNGKWNSLLNRNSNYGYLPVNGENYEWDVTPAVRSRWDAGETDVEIAIDYDTIEVAGEPSLVVTYSDGSVQKVKNADPVGPAVTRNDSQSTVKLYYTSEDAAKYKASSLKIYGWNNITRGWEAVSGTVNNGDNSLSTADATYSKYSIMSVGSSSEELNKSKNNLGQNYPNPFNPGTTIEYSLDSDSHVTMVLYNVRGQKVANLVNEYKSAGNHSVYFGDGEKLSRGVYYYQIRAGDFVSTKRMVVLH